MFRKFQETKILFILAVIISLILSIDLAVRGYDFVADVTAGLRAPDRDFPNWISTFKSGLAYTWLNVIYFIWLFRNKHSKKTETFKQVLQCGAVFPLIAFTAYPTTGDIRLYLHYGLMGLQGVNPYIIPAGSFNSSLSPFLAWQQTSTYGMLSQVLFMVAAAALPSLIAGVYVFKLFCLLFHVLNSYLIWRSLPESRHKSIVTLAYLINPFLLFEQVTEAHLDVCVATTLILFTICIKQGRYVGGILALWMGFLTKTLPVIWLPLTMAFLIKKRQWKSILVSTLISLVLVFTLSKTLLPTTQAWMSLTNPGVNGQANLSVHAFVIWVFSGLRYFSLPWLFPSNELVSSIFSGVTYVAFSACYLWLVSRVFLKKDYSEDDLILSLGWITVALFVLVTAWYCSWYATILAPIVVLNLHSKRFVHLTVILSVLISCCYYMFYMF